MSLTCEDSILRVLNMTTHLARHRNGATMAITSEITPTAAPPLISGLVPMVHVEDVERAVAFYRLLGFEIGNFVPPAGRMHWAWLYVPKTPDWKRGPNLMLTRSECAIDSAAQEVLFYLYANDLEAVRSR